MEARSAVVEVHCLACGTSYEKPDGGGTVKTNPGCPVCGYAGWSPGAGGLNSRPAMRHSAGDPQRPRPARIR